MDRRTLDIVIKASNETRLAFEEIKHELDGINDKLGQTARKATEAGVAMGFFAAAWALITRPTGWAQAIIFAVAALGPFIPIVVAATVALGAFVVGLAAVGAVMGIALGVIGALGAGIVYLGNAAYGGVNASKAMEAAHKAVLQQTKLHKTAVSDLATAQAKYNALPTAANLQALTIAQANAAATSNMLSNAMDDQAAAAQGVNGPLEVLKANFSDMVNQWEIAAYPVAVRLLTAFAKFIPVITEAGTALITWFDQRLTPILSLVNSMATSTFQLLGAVFKELGKVVDTVLGDHRFQAFFASIAETGGRAFVGLVDNLLRLSDWFLTRLPSLAPIAAQVFGFLGNVIQGIGLIAGKVVDFFIQNWPKITAFTQAVADGIKKTVNDPLIQSGIKQISTLWQDVTNRLHDLKDLAPLVGLAFKAAVVAIVASAELLLGVADILERIVAAMQFIADNWGSLPGGGQGPTGGTFKGVPLHIGPTASAAAGSTGFAGGSHPDPRSRATTTQTKLLTSIDNHLAAIRKSGRTAF